MRSCSTRGVTQIRHKGAAVRRSWPVRRSPVDPGLTAAYRRQICIHEAGHAVINGLSGRTVYRLAVAPVGVTSWEIVGSDGTLLTDAWALVSTSRSDGHEYICWDDAEERYLVDRDGWQQELRSREHMFGLAYGKPEAARRIEKEYRLIRADIVGFLAGPAAEAVYTGADVGRSLRCEYDSGATAKDDLVVAHALTELLPSCHEYEHLARVTEQALRQPEIWNSVIQLATELERVGEMRDCDEWLPEPVPQWPPAPVPRIATPARRRRR